jgi:hypothetical protein
MRSTPLLLALATLPAAALADVTAQSPDLTLARAAGTLSLDTTAAYAQEPAPGEPSTDKAAPLWGVPGSWWMTIGAGAAHNLEEDTDLNLHVALSTFLGNELEFAVELGGWYFAQDGSDAGGVNPNMVFRWHFLHDPDFKWSFYGDAGIGLLFSTDDVPDGGTSINFTPRLGVGYTHQIADDGARLHVGHRIHHISNGRFQGDEQNPSRDSVMFYVGIIFPL